MSDMLTRNLHLSSKHTVIDVPVSISWPVFDQYGWSCEWAIGWPDRRRSNVGCGVDAIQAVLHAMQMVGAEIYCSGEHLSGGLTWTGDAIGYGFPVPNNIRDLLAGDDAKFL